MPATVTLRLRRVTFAFVCALSLLVTSTAYADSLTLTWDPSFGSTTTGYAVYVSQAGATAQRHDVGLLTSFTLTNAVAGQRYCFSVASYSAAAEGTRSSEVCGYSNQFPQLTNPGTRTSTAGQSASLQLAGSDPEGQPLTYGASGMPPGLQLMAATGFISGTPTTAGNYVVTASVSDGVLTSASQSFTWTVSAASTSDRTNPAIAISGPTTNTTYSTSASTIALSGTATDNVSVSSVTWSNSRGGSGTANGAASWSVASVGLQIGSNVITVTARDAAGNVGADTVTVTRSGSDTTLPTISISIPTTAPTLSTTSPSLTLGGTAADNIGVTAVTWASDRGGSGTAAGTTSWRASLTLLAGVNVVTVTARDAAGNQSTDAVTVTYSAGDSSAPTVSIAGPTTASTYSTTRGVVTLGGSASDDRGVTAVTWANDRGGSGFTSGTTSWSVASVNLYQGTNVITVTAQDADGNRGTDVLTVTYAANDTTLPTVSITGPTTGASYSTTSSTLAMSGVASDNVAVTEVSWTNDRGGSGMASGLATWNASVPLQLGSNVITVRVRDGAGNQASDVLTVSYAVSSSGSPITLTGALQVTRRSTTASLQWTLTPASYMDVYRNDVIIASRTNDDGSYVDTPTGAGPFTYRVCVSGSTICSNTLTLFR